ncbi:MAG: hypothetical protein EA373_00215 [Oceanospirillales bacterium]|nr:MAG: hypothetical protein EA373_00215 [Oceanospirillales bacterium]
MDVVCCRAGDYQVAFEAHLVQSAQHTADTSPALETQLGLAPPPAEGRHRLRIKGYPEGLTVAAPLELIALPIGAIHPLPPLIAARPPWPALRALGLWNEQLLFILDLSQVEHSASSSVNENKL